MDANIYLAKSIIDGYRNHQFKRIYPFATENVAGCFSGYDFKDKDCLTVLGSGVQALYMFMKGAKSVCAFDINSLSIYYYEFLKAFIRSGLDFSSYRKLFIKSFGNKDNTYKQILDCMDGDYRNYFKVLYDKYGSSILSNRKLFNTVVISKYACAKYNDIFRKENLEVLRSKINDLDFRFINSDINNLELDRSYDFMYFSNIMQYVSEMYNDNMINSLSKYRELLLKFKELLNKGGSMYASYIYGIDLLAIPNMDVFCLASIEHVFEHDLIEYKSFNAFKNKFSAFIEGASKDGVLVYSK